MTYVHFAAIYGLAHVHVYNIMDHGLVHIAISYAYVDPICMHVHNIMDARLVDINHRRVAVDNIIMIIMYMGIGWLDIDTGYILTLDW